MQAQSNDQTYNGWTNYETWSVKLWLDNDHGTYERTQELARWAWHEGRTRFQGRENVTRRILADVIEEMVKDAMPDLEASMFSDLLTYAVGRVNWFEIAENILSEFGEQS
jgi:hypothetical protein